MDTVRFLLRSSDKNSLKMRLTSSTATDESLNEAIGIKYDAQNCRCEVCHESVRVEKLSRRRKNRGALYLCSISFATNIEQHSFMFPRAFPSLPPRLLAENTGNNSHQTYNSRRDKERVGRTKEREEK
ncbi:hypothetical protein EVAR_49956_1 [Eumeta japonica]|uniref:Uncharacterized protein n=1 Tax=Eumeta variegata TaxID=151549 RepID=A0A4C1XSV5_EUMVA|nr:hypothetical protein EVAR_49956_1 [Eumeta japonica]